LQLAHELSEEECLGYFPVLITSMLLILGEDKDKQIKENRIRDAKKALDALQKI